jgi:DNA-binding Xre family transcriptional regulator
MISYDPLWKTMKEKGCSTYTLRKNDEGGVSSSTVRRLKANQSVSTNTLDMLCRILKCGLQDIAEYIPDEE